ncbi:MAG TPA: 1-deoxy-D-xylulose-5-phosphate reductoisomerase [Bacillota bacterium]
MKGLVVLGSTGSIGRSTLQIVADEPGRFRVVALAARRSVDAVIAQAHRFRPRLVALADPTAAAAAARQLRPLGIEVVAGPEGIEAAATYEGADTVVAAIVGMAGLPGTLAALRAGRTVVLANKEALVAAGPIVKATAAASGARILPADSEHNAIFQCLAGREAQAVRRIWLTASGGPFRGYSREQLEHVTPAQALRHPNWSMGPKVTVDSATLMNKGLEIIEAMHLFDLEPQQIGVVVHPQSIVHGLVELRDGGLVAHLAEPDMRLPLAYCLSYPEPFTRAYRPLRPTELPALTFEEPDRQALPCLRLAEEAARIGGTMPAVLNAANEEAVAAFLAGRLRFNAIAELVEHIMGEHRAQPVTELEAVLDADRWARERARRVMARWNG